MPGTWLDVIDTVLRRVRCRCPKCGNAITVARRKLDIACRCELCQAAFIPSTVVSVGEQRPASVAGNQGRALDHGPKQNL